VKRLIGRAILAAALAVSCISTGCTLINKVFQSGGEEQLTKTLPPVAPAGPHVLILALDGGGHDQLMRAIRGGDAPFIAALMGKEQRGEVFEHAYSALYVESMLPSSTVADWSAIFTGAPPAYDGVPGDEWFVRETRQFYAPVPVTVVDTNDFTKMVTDDLVGKAILTPTLYDLVGMRSYVSLLMVHRGATLFTIVDPSAFTGMALDMIKGALVGEDAEKSVAGSLDSSSVSKVVEAINAHGLPNLQIVYFPGLDIYTHEAENPLESQLRYYKRVVDPAVGQILEAYREKKVLKDTYVLIIADHGHTPVMKDDEHAIGVRDDSPFGLLKQKGFRVRKPLLALGDLDKDYQAVVASQGFMEYIYLADRSTCPRDGDQCEWARPPRYNQDVLPVLRALYRSNRWGKPIAGLKGTIDLIFSREPVAKGVDALPFEIFDGRKLVPIRDYLYDHPRDDLIDLETRMRWLGAGPYGNRAGDIVLLARTGQQIPIEQRYYFALKSHYSWHGSADWSDSNIPLILARESSSGEELRRLVEREQHDPPSELDITPLVRSLFQPNPGTPPHR
jgi:type I phosphodiesterase/nucleotide pyrophosphatase